LPKQRHANAQGDNDPTDVIDISSRALPQGMYRGKILGAYALIDDGELDWKASNVARL
jgi:inorganic pyrophosphatase